MSKPIELVVTNGEEDDEEPLEEMRPIRLPILNSNIDNSVDGFEDGESGRSLKEASSRRAPLSEVLKRSLKSAYEKERQQQIEQMTNELLLSEGTPVVKKSDAARSIREQATSADNDI